MFNSWLVEPGVGMNTLLLIVFVAVGSASDGRDTAAFYGCPLVVVCGFPDA